MTDGRRVRLWLLVLALACLFAVPFGLPFLADSEPELHVLLLDLSRSHGVRSGLLLDAALESFPRRRAEAHDRLCVIAFGSSALVLQPPFTVSRFEPRLLRDRLPGPAFREGSDLQAAREALVALAPRAMPLDVMVAGDGRYAASDWSALRGTVARSGGRLAASGPLLPPDEDVSIALAGPPPVLLEGRTHRIAVRVAGHTRAPRVVTLSTTGTSTAVALHPGRVALVELPVSPAAGAATVSVRIEAAGGPDACETNDVIELPVAAPGRRSVALIGMRLDAIGELLRAQGLNVVLRQALPDTGAAALGRAEAVVLADVPYGAGGLTPTDVAWLVERVRSEGRGLLVLGGPRAFAAGDYGSSALEGFLPLSSRPAGRRRVVVLLDHSGSMEREGRLGRAVAAVRRLAAGLGPGDSLQVLPFAGQPGAPVPARESPPATLLGAAGGSLDALAATGSTRLEPALRAGLGLLEGGTGGRRRVLVVLSDFRDRALDPVAGALRRELERLRCSTVAVLLDSDAETRRRCRALGGRLVEARGVTPGLLLRALLGKGWLQEPREVLAGGRPLGSLRAFNPVRAERAARVVWAASRDEPLLGTVRRGAGRVSALATDPLLEGWTRVALGDLVRQVLPERLAGRAWWESGTLVFHMEDPVAQGAVIVEQGGRRASAREVAPGRFEAALGVPRRGPARVLDDGAHLLGMLWPAPAPDAEYAVPSRALPGLREAAGPGGKARPIRWPLLLAALLLMVARLVLGELLRPPPIPASAERFSPQAGQAGGR